MGKISLLDCTLRDGGYINDWSFGEEAIDFIVHQLGNSGIEYIEVGFIKDEPYDKDRTVFPSVDSILPMLSRTRNGYKSKYVGMIDMCYPLPLDRIPQYRKGGLDVIRIIFKQDRIEQGFEYAKQVMAKGYEIMIQLVSTDTYADNELVDAIRKFNPLKPVAMYIVDTLGLMHKKDLMRMAYLVDHNLDQGIALGYHSHNNLQQARGNAEALVEAGFDRDLILDACVFGMGRGAGNLNEELFADYLNENFSKNYRIEPMLEIIDRYLNAIYREKYWGYSLHYYLSAKNRVHPNYAKYYNDVANLSEREFDELLRSISREDSHVYTEEKAEMYYERYRNCILPKRKK